MLQLAAPVEDCHLVCKCSKRFLCYKCLSGKVYRIGIRPVLMYRSETFKVKERNWTSQKFECAVKKFDRIRN